MAEVPVIRTGSFEKKVDPEARTFDRNNIMVKGECDESCCLQILQNTIKNHRNKGRKLTYILRIVLDGRLWQFSAIIRTYCVMTSQIA